METKLIETLNGTIASVITENYTITDFSSTST